MTKQKSAAAGAPEDQTEDVSGASEQAPITEGRWAEEYPNFTCTLCSEFHSLDRNAVVRHIASAHPRG